MSTINDLPAFVDHPDTVAFVGKNHLAYRESWLRAHKKKHSIKKVVRGLSVNFAALVAFPFWCGYRKLYVPLLGFTLLVSAAIAFEIFTGIMISGALYLLLFLIAGMRANGLYLGHIVRVFEKKLDGKEDAERTRLIKKHGGTSVFGGMLTLLAFLLMLVFLFQMAVLLAETMGFDTSHVYS